MSDKITTLRLVDNTDVFPNTKEENIPDTIMRIADLSKYVNALKSISINGDIDSTTITSDIATFTTADISTLNVSGLSQFEGEATFGSNVHIDGNVIVNGADCIVDKDGNAIVKNESLDEFKTTLLKDYMVDRYSNHIFFSPQDAHKVTLPVPSVVSLGLCTDWTDCYATCQFQGNYGTVFANGSVHFALPASMAGVTINSNRMFGHWSKSVQEIEEENFDFVFDSDCRMTGSFTFWESDRIKTVQIAEGKKVKFVQYMILPFYSCTNLTEIGAIDLSEVTNPYITPFRGLPLLKSIHMTHFKFSFDISASTQFETSDLVEIISNLDTVTTPQTLTMGATNLAKLTQDQILVATGKGWTLA